MEHQLIKRCLRQERAAQRQLYEKYRVPLFRLCLRYTNDRFEADDLFQEGFIKIFADLHQYRGEGALGGWMRRIMINVILQHFRKKKKNPTSVGLEKITELPSPEDEVNSDLNAKALVKMIQKLPQGYRTVFNLFVIEGYSHAEIAKKLNVSVNTSKSQLSKAKALLRKMLEKSMVS